MASREQNIRNPQTPQSIPLQDLSRPPDSEDVTDYRRSSRTSIGEAQGTSRTRDSIGARMRFGGRYERLAESSPSPLERFRLTDTPVVTGPSDALQPPYLDGSDGEASPLEDRSGFQEALGFAGLAFQGDNAPRPTLDPRRTSSDVLPDGARYSAGVSPYATPARRPSDEFQAQTLFGETDTTPLTQQRLQPVTWAPVFGHRASGEERTSFQTVRLSRQGSPGVMLGDDLHSIEAHIGHSEGNMRARSGSTSAQRSLSPSAAGSPLSRAGTIVRKMSQRVVNLSNEPEIVEQSIRRNSSARERPVPAPTLSSAPHGVATEEVGFIPAPIAKGAPLRSAGKPQRHWQQQVNPLKGRSLGIFRPNNPIRRKLCDLLVHPVTEPLILALIVLQTVLLTVDSASNVYNDPRSKRWGTSRIDYALLCLFVIYTVELTTRIIVSGFLFNPEEYSTIDRRGGIKAAVLQKVNDIFSTHQRPIIHDASSSFETPQPSLVYSFTGLQADIGRPEHTRQQQRIRLAQRAFLRHSFNRLDFLAVISFWIAFALGLNGVESEKQLYVFRMLSCLRILRLLGITSGTSVILRSLKRAAPLLVNVAFLIGFFWLLFAIVGLQSFKASLRRKCIWVDPEGVQPNFTNPLQFCGGQLNNITGEKEPFYNANGGFGNNYHKGFLCPRNSVCVQENNPYNGTVSFDNILHSLELVFVVMSSNTFSELLYYTTHSDYLASALFFAAGIVIMSLWLMNLLVAVITSCFQVIREESKASAFTGAEKDSPLESAVGQQNASLRTNSIKKVYDKTSWIWIIIIASDLVSQACRSARMSRDRAKFIDTFELIVTLLLVLDIVFRFVADWRYFHRSKRNWVDLGLAIITTVIQIPQIRRSGQPYAWLTVFQILRAYRVVLAISVTRDLIVLVLGNVSGILNLIVFVLLITFLAAIFAVQLFRGGIPQVDSDGNPIRVTFFTIYNSFLGMYQVLSSENWTSIMYNVTSYHTRYNTAWIGATFFVIWFILANFIVLNMFIAVIQENFDMTEDEKRLQQIKAFLQRKELGPSTHGNLSLSTILKLGRGQKQRDPLDYGPATMEMLLKEAVVKDFLDDQPELLNLKSPRTPRDPVTPAPEGETSGLSAWWHRLMGFFYHREPNPFYDRLHISRAYEDMDPRSMAQEVVSAREKRKRAQREYLLRHPRYNVSLFLFKPSNPIRRLCQYMVGPGRGDVRIEGVEPIKAVWYTFSAFIYLTIVVMVVLACITTPLYQREYFETHPFKANNWFVVADLAFAIVFTVEAIIKIIADGFFWTPNAYFRGAWGFIDGIVLITLWIGVGTALTTEGAMSRAVGSFKALRALRLLNVSDSARNTFHSAVIRGGWKVISAAFVSLSLLIPFALYGLNLFNGQMQVCNDNGSGIANLSRDCVGEYSNHLYDWDVLSPRAVSNPHYSFDDFGSALFILFQIVSQEGWVDVMWSAQSMTGRGLQPQPFASQGNAIFFVVFNLLGSVFVLTLFVTVFMRNYTEQTGVAFLTAEQRSWLEMRKLLRQISPSKRPSGRPNQSWQNWCYRQAIQKHGLWQRIHTVVLLLHLLLLVLEYHPMPDWWDRTREYIFLTFTLFYIANIIVRIVGLTWTRFRKSSWDLYSVVVVGGTFVTTLLRLARHQEQAQKHIHKICLVLITLLLIPRNNQLDQLFKTAAASLPTISNLLATWFVLFLVYAIALTQTLGLTKFGASQNGNLNFRTVPKALILLFRMSSGEGWNQIMEDFARMEEPYCVRSDDFLQSDCGSEKWARALLVSWNILSMYIFVSLFVSLIFESFSYVYQRSNGLSVLSRGELRRFKQAWATFDPEGTGFISKQTFPRLLGELSGVFEMQIYHGDFTVGRILEDCRSEQLTGRGLSTKKPRMVEGVDLDRLNQRISEIPVHEIRRRRQRLNIFYEEILVSADPERGISFTSVLMILAHYKVINDNKSLRLEEFLRRRARLQRVEEQVRRNIVVGFFDMMYWTRFLRRTLESRRASNIRTLPNFAVPEIVVAGEDEDLSEARRASVDEGLSTGTTTPVGAPQAGRMSSSARSHHTTTSIDTGVASTAHQLRNRAESRPSSPSSPTNRGRSMDTARRWGGGGMDGAFTPTSPSSMRHHRPFDGGAAGVDDDGIFGVQDQGCDPRRDVTGGGGGGGEGDDSAATGAAVAAAANVLDVLDNSAWGESIRRSFTLRRQSRGG